MTSLSISYPSIPSDLSSLSDEEFMKLSCSYAIECSKVHEAHVAALPAEAHLVVDLQVEVPEALPDVHQDLPV